MKEENTILFFDGVCGLCNRSVNFLMSIDSGRKLKFAPLQGSTAKKILNQKYISDLDSMALYLNGKVYTRSTAVLKAIIQLGGFWKIGMVLFILPRFLRDGLYNLIAKVRYKLFGKKDSCRIPTKEEKDRILL